MFLVFRGLFDALGSMLQFPVWNKYRRDLIFLKLKIDENDQFQRKYDIFSTP